MKIFKDYTLHWWQFGLLKLSLIAFGILLGSRWANMFSTPPITIVLLVLFIVPSLYLIAITLKQTAK
jgi:uncharacterized membrane protein